MKDWNDNEELVEDWPIPIAVKYSDPLEEKSFETTMTLVFHPIRYMMNKKYDRRPSAVGEIDASEFRAKLDAIFMYFTIQSTQIGFRK